MYKKENTSCLAVLILYGFIILCLIPFIFWTDRTLDFWCTYWSNHTIDVPLWLSAITTIVGNGLMILLNIISEIVRLCIF